MDTTDKIIASVVFVPCIVFLMMTVYCNLQAPYKKEEFRSDLIAMGIVITIIVFLSRFLYVAWNL